MILRRFWLDADDRPHVEEVTLAAARTTSGQLTLPAGVEIEGRPITGPARAVAVVDPVCGAGALGAGLDAVYSAPPLVGARLVSRDDWQTAIDRQGEARVADLAALLGEN